MFISVNDFVTQFCHHSMIHLQIKNVFIALIDRLAIYASSEGVEIPDSLPLFEIFSKQTQSVIMSREGMPPEDVVSLQVGFSEFRFGSFRIFRVIHYFQLENI